MLNVVAKYQMPDSIPDGEHNKNFNNTLYILYMNQDTKLLENISK